MSSSPSSAVRERRHTCVHDLLEEHAHRTPDAIALLAPERQPMTYGRLWRHVLDMAAVLNGYGIGIGDRVAIVLPNGPEAAATFLSVSATATCAPLNPGYRANEFEAVLRDLLPKALIVQTGVVSPARATAHDLGIPVLELSPHTDDAAGGFTLASAGDARPARTAALASADSVALVLHTSGTTSRPKIVPLTHANLWHSARNIAATLDLQPADRCLNVMPLFHVHGLVGALLSSLAAGSSIVCAPDFIAPKFFDWLVEFEPTWYTAVPTMHQAIAAWAPRQRAAIAQSRLRFVRSSSAALTPHLMAEIEDIFHVPVVEAYGMTEAAHQVASNGLPPRARKPGSVGLAAGPDVAVLDDRGHMLGPNQEGDVVIRGPNVMSGYDDDPSGHSDTFTDGWLRTGDRGVMDADGYVFLRGRSKEIINRGGEKIWPYEVDDALMGHPSIAAAIAFAVPDARLGEDVAAAVVLREHASVSPSELRTFASTRLADFKIPRHIVFLDDIPKGPTGKPQRIGLAATLGLPIAKTAEAPGASSPPRTPHEELLCRLWADMLGVPSVGVHENFFALGGDSILAMQILSRLRAATGADLPMVRFLDAPTVAEMAAELSPAAESNAPARAISPASPEGTAFPLSYSQRSIWLLSQLDPQSPIYNLSISLRLEGPLDLQALEWSVNEIVRRHDILRTTFHVESGEPIQRIAPSLHVPIDVVASATASEAASDRPFDLTRGPLIRARLLRAHPGEHRLDLDLHHIVCDAWSRRTLLDELAGHYDVAVTGRGAAMSRLPCQVADVANLERRTLGADVWDAELSFWKAQLAGAPDGVPLPAAPGTAASDGRRHLHESIRFSDDFVERLQRFSRSRNVSLFMTLAAALSLLLEQLTDEEDIVLGVPVSGRYRPELEQLVGCFINTILLRTNLAGNPTFAELLERVRHGALHAYAHQELPFDALVDAVGAPTSLERTALFNVMFDFVDQPGAPAVGGGVTFAPLDAVERMPLVDLMLYVKRRGDGLNVRLHYRQANFSPEHALDVLRRYQRLLEQAIESPDAPITSYASGAMLTDAERHRILVEWNETRRDYPRLTVHQLFELQAARSPHAQAVVFEGQALTYQELNARANRLARRLRELGVGPDVLVGLCVERSLETMVALLGILKAGGAYVPLDPGYPSARLTFMMEDARPPVLVTQSHLRGRMPPGSASVVCVDDCDSGDMAQGSNLDVVVPDDRLAYVIYTSGSTGQPKGAMNTHRAVANHLQWMQERFQLCPADSVLAKTPLGFDLSVWELFWPIIAGARQVVARPEGHLDNTYLARVIRDEQITAIHFVPSMLDQFLNHPEAARCDSLRLVLAGGETLSPELQAKCLSRLPAQLFNLYGPSEAAVAVTSWQCERESVGPTVPIGRPIANARVYILDGRRNPVPIGVSGELHIAGVAVGPGYWQRPELTAAKFVRDVFAEGGDARMYKTGDRARYLPDGTIEFLGRLDHQVKLHGIRIEPAEVEAAIRQHPAVAACLVTLHQAAGRDPLLTAYVVPRDGAALPASDLRSFTQSVLPASLVPAAFVTLDAFPLGPSGKIDRRALPPPDTRPAARDFIAPRNATERQLVAIWEEILDVESLGVTDDFFDLGGDSLAAIRVFDQIQRQLGAHLAPSALIRAATVEALANLIGGLEGDDQPHSLG